MNEQERRRDRRRIIERRRRRRRASWICIAAAVLVLLTLIPVNLLTERWEQEIRVRYGQRSVSIQNGKGRGAEDGKILFTPEFSDPQLLREASAAACRTVAEEGIVLLKNEDSALPLRAGARISVFGRAAADPYFGDVSGGAYYGTKKDGGLPEDFRTVLTQAGFQVNAGLWDFYARGGGNTLTGKLQKSLEEYSDAAIVLLTRTTADLASAGGDPEEAAARLQLTEEEGRLLELAGTCSDKVIVVLNTGNPMETGFLRDYEIDACLWTGGFGQTGLYALAAILNGTVNPSGHLPDTFVYDTMSAPSMANAKAGELTGSLAPGENRYQVYAEGIYVGYRYYETRYEDVMTGASDPSLYRYEETVAFPFGYGLSYTDFSWDGAQLREIADGWNYSVRVTNKGDVSGSEVVQLYLQKPYTAYDREKGIEKPAAELIGFARTGVLAPGETETVTLHVTADCLDSFDDEAGRNIREKGEYYITAARNAHQAVNSFLAEKGAGADDPAAEGTVWPAQQVRAEEQLVQVISLGTDLANGSPVRLSGADLRRYDSSFRYLSRADWEGTWPVLYAEGQYKAPARLLEDLRSSAGEERSASSPVYNTIHGSDVLQLAALAGVKAEDYRWGWLMDQFSWRETYRYVRKAGGLTNAVTASGVPEAFGKEGSSGLTGEDGRASGMLYPSAGVLAAAFDTALARRVGQLIGEDGLQEGTTYWYLPAMCLHRLPTGERTAASLSEDPLLTGAVGASLAGGARERGMVPVAGVLSLSGEPAGEHGTAVFAKEQAVRELYLPCLEQSVRAGAAGGITVGTGRLGAVWCGGSRTLLEEVLRGEWGFDGFVMTDRLEKQDEACCSLLQGLYAGTDLWRNTDGNAYTLRGAQLTYGVRGRFRTAVLRCLVVLSGSNAMNGLSDRTRLSYERPRWRKWRIAGNAAAIMLAAALVALSARIRGAGRKGKRTDEKKRNGSTYSGSGYPRGAGSGRTGRGGTGGRGRTYR